MRKTFLWTPCVLLVFTFAISSSKFNKNGNILSPDSTATPSLKSQLFSQYVSAIYQSAKLKESGLDEDVFKKSVTGYYNLKIANILPANSSVVTIVDLAKSSRSKRMWIVDLQKRQLILNTWVSHGQKSGDDLANHFSNDVNSFESSLGFYITDNTYMGKHGLSLRLNGMDAGFNDKANERDIVVHAAPYVSTASIKELGRLGRSQGCPAVSPDVAEQVINTIKGKTVLFINGNDSNYNSKYLNPELAARFVVQNDTVREKIM